MLSLIEVKFWYFDETSDLEKYGVLSSDASQPERANT